MVSDSLRDGAPKGSDLRTYWLNLHMSVGILLFFVTIARIGWGRLVPSPPPVPAPRWSMYAARAARGLLMLATLLIPVFGYLRVASKGRAADFFRTQISSVVGDVPWLHSLMKFFHGEPMELFPYALVSVHAAAALWHQYVLHDGTLDRMLPWGAKASD
jgi:cytochrome b561